MLGRENLFKWQSEAAARAASGPVLIAAQMGSGKTITALTAIVDALERRTLRRVLLIAPRIILDTVHAPEAARWEHTKKLRFDQWHNASGGDADQLLFRGKGHIVTATPAMFSRLVQDVFTAGVLPFDGIVVDESQRFKNPDTVGAHALRELASVVPHVVFLSGTPTPNGPIDAWSPGRILQGGDFWGPSFHPWRARNFTKYGRFGWRPRPGVPEAVETELAKFSIAMRLADTSDVPPAVYSQVRFEHDQINTDRVRDLVSRGAFQISPGEWRGVEREPGFELTTTDLAMLRQINQGFLYDPVRDDGTRQTHVLSIARVMALRELLEEGGIEGPVLVAAKFVADVELLRRAFPELVAYGGKTPADERKEIIARWNADKIPLLVANPASMGHGLNLQHGSAKTIIWFCNDFSYELFAQMNARLIRTGQNKVVSVVQLMGDAGVDDAIIDVLNRKENSESALIARLMRGR